MVVTAWVLLVAFGLFSVLSLKRFVSGVMSYGHGIFWFVALLITGVSAGIIWGGLML